MTTLPDLQAEVGAWQRDRWPEDAADRLAVVVKAAKVSEEAGELCGAALKSLPGDGRLTARDVEEEAADVLVSLAGLADLAGFDLLEVAARRWAEVRERPAAASPAAAETEVPAETERPPTTCPVPGCSIEGAHVHPAWEAAEARGLLTPEHTATYWTGDDWRRYLQAHGVGVGSALVAVRQHAEGHGWPPPWSLDAVRRRPQLAEVLLNLARGAAS